MREAAHETAARGGGQRRRRGSSRPRVVIAGGGVAALEALIALRDLLDGFLSVELVAPEEHFVYRPLVVAEPFGLATRRQFSLRQIAADHDARLHTALLEAVEPDSSLVRLGGGQKLSYDALLIALGARPRDWLLGAVHFAGAQDVPALGSIVAELNDGSLDSVAFAAPAGHSWTLPLYELALLSSAGLAEQRRGDVRLTVVTPEADPLEVFGPAAARHMQELCANRGIALSTGARAVAYSDGVLELEGGAEIAADRVIALPQLLGIPVSGLPRDADGFIPVDEHGAVEGVPGVFAAGDGVAFAIKQGGLAAQQADAAAEAIAASLGAAIEPRPFRPRLRGQLLTGLMPTYLTAGAVEGGEVESSVAANPLWWPPSKIAGRHLAPYLASHVASTNGGRLADRAPVRSRSLEDAVSDHVEIRRLALAFAKADAGRGDYRSALGWLETVEQLDGALSPQLKGTQQDWRARAG